ncbi:MAG: hypothetical protein IPQ25_10525 [Chitinophagaceae bacterium]|nr:hypothetical protein [Chitinophagaceae bacterium]
MLIQIRIMFAITTRTIPGHVSGMDRDKGRRAGNCYGAGNRQGRQNGNGMQCRRDGGKRS